ncbi:DMT family transporter [Flavobacteriaceae bacterium M23B6Z8]
MRLSGYARNLVILNLSMLFISTSGALGRYITTVPPVTIFFRALIAAIFLYAFCRYKGINVLKPLGNDLKSIALSGLFMGIHWVTYFYSLQLSNVAIGMLSIFTYPVITTFLEPLLLKTKFQPFQLLLALLVVLGIYFLVPEFSFKNDHTLAVLLGVISALFYALRNILVKKHINNYHGTAIMWYQLVVVIIFLMPFLLFYSLDDVWTQLPALATLALLTTAIGHSLYVVSFRFFSVSTASIMGSLQPLYGICIGFLFLGEYPAMETIIGGALILASVVLEGIRSFR